MSRLELLKSKEIISSMEQDVSTVGGSDQHITRHGEKRHSALGTPSVPRSSCRSKDKQDLRLNQEKALEEATLILASARLQNGASPNHLRRGVGTEKSEGIRHRVKQFVAP